MRFPLLVLGTTFAMLAYGCGSKPISTSPTTTPTAVTPPASVAPSAGSVAKDQQLTLTYFTMPG